MNPVSKHACPAKGFSILELVLVMAVLIALAGIVTPYLLNLLDRGKAGRILHLYSTVNKAVSDLRLDRSKRDIGFNPREDEAAHLSIIEDSTSNWSQRGRHQLALPPAAGALAEEYWNGPYIDKAFGPETNPYDGDTVLVDDATVLWRLLGAAGPPLDGRSLVLRLTNIPEEAAKEVDEGIDGPPPAGAGEDDWMTYGKCQFTDTTGDLVLLILDPDGS